MQGHKKLVLYVAVAVLFAASLSGCQNDTHKEETVEYGEVETGVSIDYDTSEFAGYYIFQEILSGENTYAELNKDAFSITQSDGINLTLTVRPEADSLNYKVLILACVDKTTNTYIISDGTSFTFDPIAGECIVQPKESEEKWRYRKGMSETAGREAIINNDISAGQGGLDIAKELIPGIVRKAREEGTDCIYKNSNGDSLLIIPIPSADREFSGTHLMIWSDKDYGYGDIALVYFDGEYGERQAEVLGYRRSYSLFTDIQPDSIDDYQKTTVRITEKTVREMIEAYRETGAEETLPEENESVPESEGEDDTEESS